VQERARPRHRRDSVRGVVHRRDAAARHQERRLPRLGHPGKAMADDISLSNRTQGGGPIAQLEARRRVV
jgi:hypothetical protein